MKTRIVLSVLFFNFLHIHAQNIENPSFDSVYIGGIDRIHSWITSDAWSGFSVDTVQPMLPNTHFIASGLQYHELLQTSQLEYSSAFDGPYAIKLFSIPGKVYTDGSPYKGFVVNGNHFYTDSSGYIDYKKGGTPFPYRPSKLRGHFKFDNSSPSLNNYGKAVVLLKKYNSSFLQIDTVAYVEGVLQFFPTATWTAFELPLTYYSSQTPDSVVIVLQSSASGLSSTFIVDSLGFYFAPNGIDEEAKGTEVLPYRYDDEHQLLFFNTKEKTQLAKLMDVNGKVVKMQFTDDSPLDISDLNKGIYFLEMEEHSHKHVYKILK